MNSKTLYFSEKELSLLKFARLFPFTYANLVSSLVPKDAQSFLDLGCGTGIFTKAILGNKQIKVVGVEIFDKYIKEALKMGIYKKVIKANIETFTPSEKIDVIFLSHVVEHLPKKRGIALLKRIEKFCNRRIIVIVPNGNNEQEEYDENIYQRHLSSWSVKDLQDLGFNVIGQGWKFIFTSDWIKKLGRFVYFLFLISTLSQPLLRVFPQLSLQLIAYKDV